MVTSWQAVKSVATRRPTVETRNSWLNLLNFMRFLRCGPSGSSSRKTRLGCPVDIVKARYGVLLWQNRGFNAPLRDGQGRRSLRSRRLECYGFGTLHSRFCDPSTVSGAGAISDSL